MTDGVPADEAAVADAPSGRAAGKPPSKTAGKRRRKAADAAVPAPDGVKAEAPIRPRRRRKAVPRGSVSGGSLSDGSVSDGSVSGSWASGESAPKSSVSEDLALKGLASKPELAGVGDVAPDVASARVVGQLLAVAPEFSQTG